MSPKLALVVLSFILTSPSRAQEASWHSYTNPRFGVSCEYPATLSLLDQPPDNGDGQAFRTADGRARLSVFGSYNVDHEAAAQLMAERKMGGTSYSYLKATKGWFVLSGAKGSEISYLRCNLGRSDVVGCAELDYPAAEAAKWADSVKRVSGTLKVRP